MNRRKFIQNATGLTLATLASGSFAFSQNNSLKLNIVIFWEENFPAVDSLNLSKEMLQTALNSHNLIFTKTDELNAKLSENIDLFINPYGSAFPRNAWETILKYLQAGGNFLNLGGVPFAIPVRDLRTETRQVNFHKRLGILQAFEAGEAKTFQSNLEKLKDFAKNSKVEKAFALYPRLTTKVDFPEDSGSDGTREGTMNALVHGLDASRQAVSAPIVMFEQLEGEFAGARWIFANFKGTIDGQTIKTLAEFAAVGAFKFSISTTFACYHQGEKPVLKVKVSRPQKAIKPLEIFSFSYYVKYPNGLGRSVLSDPVWKDFSDKEFDFNYLSNLVGTPNTGFYKITVKSALRRKDGASFELIAETGFWITDEKLMQTGEAFTADKHFLYRNGEPFPVAGATYMASDVHRRFLLEPNPAVWDKNFSEMKAAGVNMIRTGIWTAWKLYFDNKGNVREEVLRAFEAFILTAKKYDIPVIFTFFAFMPEIFGGKNAYLDPKSIEGQKRFLSAFASRVKTANDVIWDLINEPSFANPKALWSCRPNYDEFERAAWKDWLKKRFGERDEKVLAEILREKWRLTAEENPFELPKMEDFDSVNIFSNRRPLKALDFRLFAQDTFENWAREMSKTLKESGNPAQMVTVGQDEAGTGDSPSQQFHADALDFTCLHNWWSNDDLLWDNVVSKSPAKPNMIQETGVMFYEKLDGSAWRDEQTIANLMERKMALALGANACGFIEWIWNTNPFMNIDNEAGIGFLRVDGTAKPELFSFLKIAEFANENRRYFRGKEDEKTMLVIPHSYQFTPRNFASEATKKAVRAFHYHCRRTLRAVSEYNLETILAEKEVPNLIILPSPRTLTETAWENLLQLVEKGATLAITGYFADDEHFLPQPRFKDLGSESIYEAVPISQFEKVSIDGKNYQVRFAGEKIQRVEKASFPQDYVWNARFGEGEVFWCKVPLEIGETLEPIAAFYNFALKKAKLLPYFSLKDDNPAILVRPTEFQDTILYTCVNESDDYFLSELTHLPTDTKIELKLPKGQTEMFFVDKRTGKRL